MGNEWVLWQVHVGEEKERLLETRKQFLRSLRSRLSRIKGSYTEHHMAVVFKHLFVVSFNISWAAIRRRYRISAPKYSVVVRRNYISVGRREGKMWGTGQKITTPCSLNRSDDDEVENKRIFLIGNKTFFFSLKKCVGEFSDMLKASRCTTGLREHETHD